MDEPALLSLALLPKTDADRERLTQGLQHLMGENPALRVTDDASTGEVVIAALSEQQLEIAIERLARAFNVEARVGCPRVAYKEAFTQSADGEVKYAKRGDGRGQYAHVKIRLYPGELGSGYVFESRIIGGAIPDAFIPSVDAGIKEALTHGVLAGYPIQDVRVELYDGSYHDTDSSEAAFKIAGAMAFQDAARKAGPVLLEPVMRVEVVVPRAYVRDVLANLLSRRGRVQSREDRGNTQMMGAHVPFSEMFGYSTDLRERTRGRGTCVMQLDHYQPVRRAEDDAAPESFVGAPRRPWPAGRGSGVALPEPEETPDK